jgi:hypothetical protein
MEMIHDTRVIPLRVLVPRGQRHRRPRAVGRAFDREVAEAKANGLPPPKRTVGMGIYGRPQEGAEVFNITRGE